MNEIVSIEGDFVLIGTPDGKLESVTLASVKYDSPKQGDKVKIFKDGDNVVVTRIDAPSGPAIQVEQPTVVTSQYVAKEKSLNKNVFVWVGAFLFGGLGVDRFMRGQIGLGILKIITIGALGIWSLIDWIIAMVKAYGSAFGKCDDITFINGKYAR